MPILPISFSVHRSRIISFVPKKKKMVAHIIPGKLETYIYDEENAYYNDYRDSYFGITTCKAGWDCMRHYEILANGCIPYFVNIGSIPEHTMFNFPKEIIKKTNAIYDGFCKNPEEINTDILDMYINELLIYCRKHLTNDAIASYILEKTGHTNAKKILFLCDGIPQPDFLRCMTLAGFKDLFGSACHDWPKVNHIYIDGFDYASIDGFRKGFTFTHNVPIEARNDDLDNTIFKDISNKVYDIIIYGSFHRALPHHDLVKQVYKSNEIIYLCGEDFHYCNPGDYGISENSFIFIRELS